MAKKAQVKETETKVYEDYNEFKKDFNYNDPNYAFYYKFIKRPISYPLCWIVYHTSLTPNTLTIIGAVFALLAGISLRIGTPLYLIIAAICFFIFELSDDFDGVIARSKNMSSKRGGWLDALVGIFGKSIILAGASIGLYYTTNEPVSLIYGIVGMFGYFAYNIIDNSIKIHFLTTRFKKLKFAEHAPKPETLEGKLSIFSELIMNLWYVVFFLASIFNVIQVFVIFSAIYYPLYAISQFLYRNHIYSDNN